MVYVWAVGGGGRGRVVRTSPNERGFGPPNVRTPFERSVDQNVFEMSRIENREQFSDAATKRPSAEHERDKMVPERRPNVERTCRSR
jgi:hypothetical protein